jgi:hypothetical protein
VKNAAGAFFAPASTDFLPIFLKMLEMVKVLRYY